MKNKKIKEINIFTVKFDSSGWILEVIDSIFYLFNKNFEYRINIKILDDYKDNYIKNYLKFFLHYIFYFFNLKKNNKILKNKYFKNKFVYNSFYYKIFLGREVKFIYKNYNFTISKTKVPLTDKIYFQIKSILYSLFFTLNFLLFKKKKYFFEFQFKNFQFGSLVASTFLRTKPKYGGEFKYSLGLFLIFKKAILNILISPKIIKKVKKKNSYIILPEPVYLQVLWKKIFLKNGITAIETHHYKGFSKLNEDYKNAYPWIAEKKKIKKIDNETMNKITTFFKKRFYTPEQVMSYMIKENTNNNKKKEILNIFNKKIILNKDDLYSVVFLHSFSDAQYCFGYDGFLDIYEWTIFTIDKCLENKNFQKILIKPHPGLDYIKYPGDKIGVEKIINRYENNPKVEILKKDVSVVNLFKNQKYIVGFTHHGSVAEEITFLKKKVVGYVNGTWGSNFKFLETWKNKNEYNKILSKFDKKKIKPMSNYTYRIFYNYILERKINIKLRQFTSIRVLLANSQRKYKKWGTKGEIKGFYKFVDDIKTFPVNQKFIKDLIKPIYDRSNIKKNIS